MNAINFSKLGRRVLLAVALALAGSLPVQASLIISAGTTTANAGTTGNAFDITLSNSGPSAITLGAFALEISVLPSTDVSFTSATTATSQPYVFAGDSLFGPNIDTLTGQTLDASDVCSACLDAIASGVTVGLAHVFFDVLPGAQPGLIAVSFGLPYTSLSDLSGQLLDATLQSGTITINDNGTSVPEPSTLALLALPAIVLVRKRFGSPGAA